MGTDIHFFVEVFKNNRWKLHNWELEFCKVDENGEPIYDKYGELEVDFSKFFNSPFCVGRNYDLFSILANVRNGVGFAGVDTGDGFTPISEPRGLPLDVSLKVQKESDNWGDGGHSHSWLTVKELLEYNWQQTTKKRGKVSQKAAAKMAKTGEAPGSYCGGTTDKSYVCAEWEVTYEEACQYFINKTIPALQKLGAPEEVRIVFWFDN